MDEAALDHFTDVAALRGVVRAQWAEIAQSDEALARRDHEIAFKDAKIAQVTHEIARLRRVQLTVRSERMDLVQPEQLGEAMAADTASLQAGLASLKVSSTPPPIIATIPRIVPGNCSAPSDWTKGPMGRHR